MSNRDDDDDYKMADDSGDDTSRGSGYEDGYGSDLIGDDQDRKELMAMPELQREQILLKRNEQRQMASERKEAQRKWKLEQQKKKGKESVDKDDKRSRRGIKRQKGKESALEDIRARRNKRIREKQSASAKYDHDIYADEEDDETEEGEVDADFRPGPALVTSRTRALKGRYEDESDEDEEMQSAAKAARYQLLERPEDSRVIDHVTCRSLQIRRDALEKMLDEPFFEDVCIGMFTRIGLGKNSRGVSVYRCVEIIGVTEHGRRYQIGKKNTKKRLRVAFGKNEENFRMELISNHSITNEEMLIWIEKLETDGMHVPTVGEAVARKMDADTRRRKFVYTNEMVADMVKKRQQEHGPAHYNPTHQRLELRRQLAIAEAAMDNDAIAEINGKIDDLNESIQKQMRRTHDPSIEQCNQRARQANQEVAEKVRIQRSQQEKQQDDQLDPFQRRRTRPTMSVAHAGREFSLSPPPRQRGGADESTSRSPNISTEPRLQNTQLEHSSPTGNGHEFSSSSFLGPDASSTLRKLVNCHKFDLKVDVNARPRPYALRTSYKEMYPTSFSKRTRWSERDQFSNTLTLEQWRQRRGLD